MVEQTLPSYVLYLHGFSSSPQSFKARMLQAHFVNDNAVVYACPQLSVSPAQAIEQAHAQINQWRTERLQDVPRQLVLIGSSLGGFYATYLAQHYECRAVLLNPGVFVREDLSKYVGMHRMYHSNELFEFKARYLDELDALRVTHTTSPKRYLLIAAKGDEVLDWRDMVAHYPGAQQLVLEGSDHGLSDFEQHLEVVMQFIA